MLSRARAVAPGLAAAAATATAGSVVAARLPERWHVSPIPVSIGLGALAAAGPLGGPAARAALAPGLKVATSTVLRSGIVCVGFKLSGAEIASLGWATVPAAAASVTAGVVCIPALARAAGLTPTLGALLAAGTSVCGVTAISAVAPAVAAAEAEVAIAVANVVAFGTCGMLVYPHVAARLFPADDATGGARDSRAVGLFLGLAVHDTAQVMGAAASFADRYDDATVVGAAAVAKLTRNVYLAAVVPYMSFRYAVSVPAAPVAALAAAVPTFVAGFLAAAAARTVGDAQLAAGSRALGAFDAETWRTGVDRTAAFGTKVLLATGLAGVGLGVQPGAFRGVGPRPFLVGAAGATIVGGVGLAGALAAAR